MQELKYSWCWHCNVSYATCPQCGNNSCSAGCPQGECSAREWWAAVIEAETKNLPPAHPAQVEVEERIAYFQTELTRPLKDQDIFNFVYNSHIYRNDLEDLAEAAMLYNLPIITWHDLKRSIKSRMTPEQYQQRRTYVLQLRKK